MSVRLLMRLASANKTLHHCEVLWSPADEENIWCRVPGCTKRPMFLCLEATVDVSGIKGGDVQIDEKVAKGRTLTPPQYACTAMTCRSHTFVCSICQGHLCVYCETDCGCVKRTKEWHQKTTKYPSTGTPTAPAAAAAGGP